MHLARHGLERAGEGMATLLGGRTFMCSGRAFQLWVDASASFLVL
jgi:hypothetical protein